MPGASSMATVSPVAATLHRLGRRIGDFSGPHRSGLRGRLRRGLALAIEAASSIPPIRGRIRALRRAGVSRDDLAVLLYGASLPFWATVASAPKRGRWVVLRFRPPSSDQVSRSRGAIGRIAASRHRRRRGSLRIAAATSEATTSWKQVAPWLDVRTVPTGITTPVGSTGKPPSRREARAHLRTDHGIVADVIALALGADRPDRDFETLLQAFRPPDNDTHLVVAGEGIGARIERVMRDDPRCAEARATVRDDFVPDDELEWLYAAADCLILAYRPEMRGDSGLLSQAVSRRVPVICADACEPARIVGEYEVGVLFRDGDPASLRRAVERIGDSEIPEGRRATYLADFSPTTIARRLIALAEDDVSLP